jgi:hypothetical protein
MRALSTGLTVLMLAFVVAGCGSIYHKHRDRYPADPQAHLEIRVKEALRAEKVAEAAANTLRTHLRQGPPDAIPADLDRVETAALELARRVSAARDAAERCEVSEKAADELNRLTQRSRELLDEVKTARSGSSTAAAKTWRAATGCSFANGA